MNLYREVEVSQYILSIDQGTTSSRAIVFNQKGEQQGMAQQEFEQIFPKDAWVEHRAEDIWESTISVCHAAVKDAGLALSDIATLGITNQRETTLLWEKSTGKAIYNALVWQDRRTADYCQVLKEQGKEVLVQEKTGLLLDPYFSASKIAWILDSVEGARDRAKTGELCFGTVDSFLIWRLTGGEQHVTDATNASRTLLFNIHEQNWDEELLDLFDIPRILLPEVKDCSDDFGVCSEAVLGAALPISGVAGDQQSALIGQACLQTGMAKSTYGTGCFMMLNTGDKAVQSEHRLLSTVAYRLRGKTTYALEGSIFIAGAAVQWLRDGLKLMQYASDTESLAEQSGYQSELFLVPAFTGLGAPYWDPDARGSLSGITRDTDVADIVSATLMSVSLQTVDLLKAMERDGARFSSELCFSELRIDGGMVGNNWFAQSLADCMQIQVERPANIETTAFGVAFLAGLQVGIYDSLEQITDFLEIDKQFVPQLSQASSEKIYQNWQKAVSKVLTSR